MRHPDILKFERDTILWNARHQTPGPSAIPMPRCEAVSPKTGRRCEQTSGRLHHGSHSASPRELWADEYEMPERGMPTDSRVEALGGLLMDVTAMNQREMRRWNRMKKLLDAGRSLDSITDEEMGE
jgi:hypothetical protein